MTFSFERFRLHLAVVVAIVGLAGAATADAQTLSAPHDTRTLPPVKAQQDGVRHIVSGATGAVERAYRAVMPQAPGADELNGLRQGQTVAVHYRARGEQGGGEQAALVGSEGLAATEGTVTDVNRRRAEVSIRFDNRKTETFRVARQDAAVESSDVSRVLIYYPNTAGEKVAHAFVRMSQEQKPQTR
jgi:hypothetical protein